MCSDKERTRTFAREVFADDLQRLEALPGTLYNFHPGSHVGQGTDNGIAYITRALNDLLTPEQHTTVLLETMAGKGSEVGGTFEELRRIIDGVQLQDKIGVCLDTCHVSDGGYPLAEDLDGVLTQFDRVIGLDRLRALHLNDSKNPCGSHKDRHEQIGKGFLGIETFRRIVNHPALRGLPMFLETPNDLSGYQEEIALLRSLELDAPRAEVCCDIGKHFLDRGQYQQAVFSSSVRAGSSSVMDRQTKFAGDSSLRQKPV